jgi:hypothetical protein
LPKNPAAASKLARGSFTGFSKGIAPWQDESAMNAE